MKIFKKPKTKQKGQGYPDQLGKPIKNSPLNTSRLPSPRLALLLAPSYQAFDNNNVYMYVYMYVNLRHVLFVLNHKEHGITNYPTLTSHLSPLTSHMSPPNSHPQPLTCHPSRLTSHLSPLAPHASPLSPLTSHAHLSPPTLPSHSHLQPSP